MVKIYSYITIGLLITGLIGPVQRADASKEKMYVSNRVKIVRPAADAPQTDAAAPGSGIQSSEEEKTVVAPAPEQAPLASATGDKKTDTGVGAPEIPVPDTSIQMPIKDQASPTVESSGQPSGKPVDGMSETAIKSEFASLMGAKEKYYIRKGRIDPFEPFLRAPEPEIPADAQAELNRRVPRTPLEKIDMSQLKLTGILRAESKTRALVQEVSGKGYIIDEGTYIGNKGGQVSKILKDRIVVSEKALDVFGKITVLERELKLQQ